MGFPGKWNTPHPNQGPLCFKQTNQQGHLWFLSASVAPGSRLVQLRQQLQDPRPLLNLMAWAEAEAEARRAFWAWLGPPKGDPLNTPPVGWFLGPPDLRAKKLVPTFFVYLGLEWSYGQGPIDSPGAKRFPNPNGG